MLAYQWKPTVCQIQLYLHEGLHFAIAPTEEEEEEEDNFDSSLQAVPVTFQSMMSLPMGDYNVKLGQINHDRRRVRVNMQLTASHTACARKMTLS